MNKKIIIGIIFVIILFIFSLAAFYLGRLFPIKQAPSQAGLVTPTPSITPSPSRPPFQISDEARNLLSAKDNFRAGVPESYRDISLYPGVEDKQVWTFLKPTEGILYTASTSVTDLVAFYQTKLAEQGWSQTSRPDPTANLINLRFAKAEKVLSILISDKIPTFLPEELKLQAGAYVSLNFVTALSK